MYLIINFLVFLKFWSIEKSLPSESFNSFMNISIDFCDSSGWIKCQTLFDHNWSTTIGSYNNRLEVFENIFQQYKNKVIDREYFIQKLSESPWCLKSLNDPLRKINAIEKFFNYYEPLKLTISELQSIVLNSTLSGYSFYGDLENYSYNPTTEILSIEAWNRFMYFYKWQYFVDKINDFFRKDYKFTRTPAQIFYEIMCLQKYCKFEVNSMWDVLAKGGSNRTARYLLYYKTLELILHPDTPKSLKLLCFQSTHESIKNFLATVYSFNPNFRFRGKTFVYYPFFKDPFTANVVKLSYMNGRMILNSLIQVRYLIDWGVVDNYHIQLPNICFEYHWAKNSWFNDFETKTGLEFYNIDLYRNWVRDVKDRFFFRLTR
jgi:hypothetical protein